RYASVRAFIDALGDGREAPTAVEPPECFVASGGGSPGRWIAAIVVLLGLAGIAAGQLGYLDTWLGQPGVAGSAVEIAAPRDAAPVAVDGDAGVPLQEAPVAESVAADPAAGSGPAARASGADAEAPGPPVETAELEQPPAAQPVDFSTLPPPAAIVSFSLSAPAPDPTRIVLREDGDPVIVDFVRDGDTALPLTLRLEEVGFSGNRSPWGSGQYALSNAGLLSFPAGRERARVTLTAASDPRREADQQSTLRLRPADSASTELAVVNVTLEDDDRRAFEGNLPANTVAFASNRISVRESDPAVQIDIVRFNPDGSSMEVRFAVEDLTAIEGEDYFAPGTYSVSFGPGQRSARLLIPLVQDSHGEGDEAFVVKLLVDTENLPANVSPNVAVTIRDDEA
ncbi:MAG: hypothetical protein MJA32_08440, partial [Proteobacteria bacterium]|nr:hypothetical protein [Pseudomonadota bacterium]